jgi:DNA-binding MurR/RpiR family transcriptional regulator
MARHTTNGDWRLPAPRDVAALRQAVLRERLAPRLAAAATYAFAHPDEMGSLPVSAIATLSGISSSTFVRLGTTLGLGGFAGLQRVFSSRPQAGPVGPFTGPSAGAGSRARR